MRKPYIELWQDRSAAAQLLKRAVTRYAEVNLGLIETSPPPKHFALDRNGDAIQELVDFYGDLLNFSAKAATSMLEASSQLYDIERLSSPPRYFTAAIFGNFLLVAAPEAMKPEPGEMLRFFRPLLNSEKQQERDLYFSAILNIGDALQNAPRRVYDRALPALYREWEALSKGGSKLPASLARLLCRAAPDQWPPILATFCEATWPSRQRAASKPTQFARAIQNILSSVDAAVIAEHMWKFADFLFSDDRRAREIAYAMFGNAQNQDSLNKTAPFELLQPDSFEIQPFEQWRVAARGATKSGRTFSFVPGELRQEGMAAYKLGQLLLQVLVGGIIIQLPIAA